jgi:hypothetical protein
LSTLTRKGVEQFIKLMNRPQPGDFVRIEARLGRWPWTLAPGALVALALDAGAGCRLARSGANRINTVHDCQ